MSKTRLATCFNRERWSSALFLYYSQTYTFPARTNKFWGQQFSPAEMGTTHPPFASSFWFCRESFNLGVRINYPGSPTIQCHLPDDDTALRRGSKLVSKPVEGNPSGSSEHTHTHATMLGITTRTRTPHTVTQKRKPLKHDTSQGASQQCFFPVA